MIKLSVNALEARRLAKSFGLIFKGTGRKWALRNLRSGKTMERLGAVGNKHLEAAMPMVKRLSRKGREVSFDVYRTRRSPILKGGIGTAPTPSLSDKIVKTFHTHPFEGYTKIAPKDVLRSVFKTQGMPKEMIDETLKDKALMKILTKQMKHQGPMPKGVEQAHPDPRNFAAKGQFTDMNFMSAMPGASHNILAPDPMILGVHKIRPKGLRTFYKQEK